MGCLASDGWPHELWISGFWGVGYGARACQGGRGEGMVEALKSGPHFGVGGYGRGSEMAWMPADHMTQPIFWSLTQCGALVCRIQPYFLLKIRAGLPGHEFLAP